MRLGRRQTEIMDVLWRQGPCNAKQITEHLNAQGNPIAHSTVQTQLRLLMKKGAVEHATEGRIFVFSASIERETTAGEAADDLLDRLFGGSATAMVRHLLDRRSLSRKELEAIRELIDTHEQSAKRE